MTTAVLSETDVLLDEENILGDKESLPNTDNFFERIAHTYRLKGYDAVCVHEDENDFDWDKYLDENTRKLLESIQ